MSAGAGSPLELATTTSWGDTIEVRFTDGSIIEMTQDQYAALSQYAVRIGDCCEQCGGGCSRETQ